MPRPLGSQKIRNAYAFLVRAEEDDRVFSLQDLMAGSTWTETTTKANISKKLRAYLRDVPGGYKTVGVKKLGEEAFCRICSQTSALTQDPERPRLAPRVESLIRKSCESALAAVQHYNNPVSVFRSGNYIMLMVVAYTALFHAIFEREGRDYKEYDNNGNPIVRDGNTSLWNLVTSAKIFEQDYSQNYDRIEVLAMLKNLEFMVPLRNKIEHQFMPQLDVNISGHCQAMLMNFEKVLATEFTSYYSLSSSLALALQFSTGRANETMTAIKRLQSAQYEEIRQFITDFHNGLTEEIFRNPAFAFRAWILPKTANRQRNSDVTIEFVREEDLSVEQLAEIEKLIVAYKSEHRQQLIDPSIACTLGRQEVLDQIIAATGAEVPWGGTTHHLTGPMINMIIKAHRIPNLSPMYYRPQKKSLGAMYGQALVDWIMKEYHKNPQFFYEAWLKSKR
jgi:Protein of unknown function (DUF3644)